jgi:hypothetical protein
MSLTDLAQGEQLVDIRYWELESQLGKNEGYHRFPGQTINSPTPMT